MRVLVTGGAGFIGSNLVRTLIDDPRIQDVRIVDDLSTGSRSNLSGLPVELVECSILDMESLPRIVRDVDSIVHLAAIPSVPRSIANPRASHDANVTGTLNVLEAARGQQVEHVITASSSSVYGANPTLPKREDQWTRPMSPYAVSKLAAENYTLAYNYSYGLNTLAFRFFNVYGPAQAADHAYAAVVPKFIDAMLRGSQLTVHGDGTQARDFTYVGTVANVLKEAVIGRTTSPSPINLAYGTRTSLLELIGLLESAIGTNATVEHLPRRAGDVLQSQADGSSLRATFPDVAPVPLSRGLAQTIDWYRTRLSAMPSADD